MKAGWYIVKSVDEILAMPRHDETKGLSKKTLLKMMTQDNVYDSVVGAKNGDFVVGMLATCGKLVELVKEGFDRKSKDCWWYDEAWVIPTTKKAATEMLLLRELSDLMIRRNEIEEELRKLNTKKGGKK
jgi:hypothetical protein